jgi:NAD(P)-dependent dehydrogenase (short-subunit alcohol dehydrogenase family)
MTTDNELASKVAIVTGAGSGIGLATATLLAEHGASVVAADWNAAHLDAAVRTLTVRSLPVHGVTANVAEEADNARMIDTAISAFGRLDILVNNAGVMDLNQPVGNLDLAVWRRVLAVNVDGPMFAMRAAMPHLLKAGGSIINVASVAGVGGAAAGAAYTASKHALIGLTLNTAWMYAKEKVRCNAIAAGGVATNIMDSVDQTKMDPAGMARAGVYYPLMPVTLDPIDIAHLVLFLAGDGSRYINGAVIPADGGWRAA